MSIGTETPFIGLPSCSAQAPFRRRRLKRAFKRNSGAASLASIRRRIKANSPEPLLDPLGRSPEDLQPQGGLLVNILPVGRATVFELVPGRIRFTHNSPLLRPSYPITTTRLEASIKEASRSYGSSNAR